MTHPVRWLLNRDHLLMPLGKVEKNSSPKKKVRTSIRVALHRGAEALVFGNIMRQGMTTGTNIFSMVTMVAQESMILLDVVSKDVARVRLR